MSENDDITGQRNGHAQEVGDSRVRGSEELNHKAEWGIMAENATAEAVGSRARRH